MAQFTVTVNPKTNLPPDQIGYNIIYITNPDNQYPIKINDVTIDTSPPYNDPENDGPFKLKIKTNTSYGTLELDGIVVLQNQEILITDIGQGKLKYIPTPGASPYEDFFAFDIADVGSGQYSGLDGGNLFFDVGGVINLPPTIGDGEADMDYQGTLVFTVEMFTSQTTPPYSDPEGDFPDYLKILSLPDESGMKLNGLDVAVNQVIDFNDIAAGLFTYTNDDVMDTNGDTQTFTFAISDKGSGQFVE